MSRDTSRHRPAGQARRISGTGLLGYVVMFAAVVLIVLAIGASAGGHDGAVWLWVGAVIGVVVSLALLMTGRHMAVQSPAQTRTQSDPLQPEVTAEEEQQYHKRFGHD